MSINTDLTYDTRDAVLAALVEILSKVQPAQGDVAGIDSCVFETVTEINFLSFARPYAFLKSLEGRTLKSVTAEKGSDPWLVKIRVELEP